MSKLLPTSLAAAVAAGAAFAPAASADGYVTAGASQSQSPQSAPANPVVEWNRALLSIVRTPGAQPATVHPTRSFAILQTSIYDAVVSIDHSSRPYAVSVKASRHDSRPAAADAAAATVLDALYPDMTQTTDAQEHQDLAALGNSPRVAAGVRAGQSVARRLLALRANDGSAATPPAYMTTGAPGDFAPSSPAVFTHWGSVHPFVLAAPDSFRPPAPPALDSPAYAAAINEVQSLGVADSTTRTDDQTQQAKFWAAPIWNYWNEIAQTAVLAHHATLDQSAKTFATLDLAQADGVIAFYDAKYHYRLWRPISAIRGADTDGNPNTTADPNWTPLANTPADPSYPGAHSVISSASASVLASAFGDRFSFGVTSEVLPGVTRSFTSFSAAAQEAGLSRIYAGVHTRLDHVAGAALGTSIGRFTVGTLRNTRR